MAKVAKVKDSEKSIQELIDEIVLKSTTEQNPVIKISQAEKDRITLKNLLRSYNDAQQLRIAIGNRVFSTVMIGLGLKPGKKMGGPVKELMNRIEKEHKLITDALVSNLKSGKDAYTTEVFSGIVEMAKPRKASIEKIIEQTGNTIVNSTLIYSLCQQYTNFQRQEKQIEMEISCFLESFPIYTEFLQYVRGCGPILSAYICSELDIWKARYASSFWKYCGLDVEMETNKARCRISEHLVDRDYINKAGEVATKKSITYNPDMKTFILGVASGTFIKGRSPYCVEFYNYLGRLKNMPQHQGKSNAHLVRMSLRRMMKIFLVDVHAVWCSLVGKPHIEYAATKLGLTHSKPFIRDLILQQAFTNPKRKLHFDDVTKALVDPEGFWAMEEIKKNAASRKEKDEKDDDNILNELNEED